MLIGADAVKAEHTYRGSELRERCGTTSHRSARRPLGRTAAVVAAVVAIVAAPATSPAEATEPIGADVPLYDPGPPWAPDYGLMCEILERSGNADIEVCRTEPVTSTHGPN